VEGGHTFSVIASDVEITGNLSAKVDLHIDGKINGDVTCGSLVQGEGSVISGKVVAETARLSGKVDGSIEAGDLVIEASARISGDVVYQSLTIAPGGHGRRQVQASRQPCAQYRQSDHRHQQDRPADFGCRNQGRLSAQLNQHLQRSTLAQEIGRARACTIGPSAEYRDQIAHFRVRQQAHRPTAGRAACTGSRPPIAPHPQGHRNAWQSPPDSCGG
jgi:cytoskeletal protein CcmA (bactofilin family)